MSGEVLNIEVAAKLGELQPGDVVLECVIGTESEHETFLERESVRFTAAGVNSKGETLFKLELAPPLSGLQFYKLRLYPSHPQLSHPFETGRILWL